MRRPFWLIDGRLREADFFLSKLRSAPSLEDARYFFSAFTAAAIAVRDAINCTLKGVTDDKDRRARKRLLEKNDTFAYFERIRNQIQHEGLNPLGVRVQSHSGSRFFLADSHFPGKDAVKEAESLMSVVVAVAAEAYGQFWSKLDLAEGYSLKELAEQGGTLEQIEAEFGLPSGWYGGATDEVRLERLKQHSRTATDDLVRRYASRKKRSISP